MARARSCPACHSIGPPKNGCQDPWHTGVRPPRAAPMDPLARELADGLRRIEYNYDREGSGPGSRFEGRLREDVQAEWILRELARTGYGEPVPAQMTVSSTGVGLDVMCREHGLVLSAGEISLRTLMFEARRHWREQHQ